MLGQWQSLKGVYWSLVRYSVRPVCPWWEEIFNLCALERCHSVTLYDLGWPKLFGSQPEGDVIPNMLPSGWPKTNSHRTWISHSCSKAICLVCVYFKDGSFPSVHSIAAFLIAYVNNALFAGDQMLNRAEFLIPETGWKQFGSFTLQVWDEVIAWCY